MQYSINVTVFGQDLEVFVMNQNTQVCPFSPD